MATAFCRFGEGLYQNLYLSRGNVTGAMPSITQKYPVQDKSEEGYIHGPYVLRDYLRSIVNRPFLAGLDVR